MRLRLFMFAMSLIAAPLHRAAAAEANPHVVIAVNLKSNVIRIFKYRANQRKPVALTSHFLAVVPGSVRVGTYRARLPSIRVKRESAASRLDHAILFDGVRLIRSSPHFAAMTAHPVAGSVVVTGEFGGVLHRIVTQAGGKAIVVVEG